MELEEIKQLVYKKVSLAKAASMQLGLMNFKQKNAILLAMADGLEKNIKEIIPLSAPGSLRASPESSSKWRTTSSFTRANTLTQQAT